jgi:hypothetical protein
MFRRILSNIPPEIEIHFSGFSEPFAHAQAHEFIVEAYKAGHSIHLYSTLSKATTEQINALNDVKFHTVCIHCPDLRFYKNNELDFIARLKHFKENHEVSLMAMGEVSDFVKTGCEPGIIEYPKMNTRAGNLNKRDKPTKFGPVGCIICGQDFTRNVVLPNGDTYLCCMDWGLRHRLGNLSENSYWQLDRDGVQKLSRKYISNLLCRSCCWGVGKGF